MEESEVSAAANYARNNSWGINFLVITKFYRSLPQKLHKNILGELFS